MSYTDLPDRSFWKRCRSRPDFRFGEIWQPAFAIDPGMPVSTAGSCFAQHIGRELRASDAAFVDMEPTPPGMSGATAARFGFGLYSARYGNVYTTAQLLQLAGDAFAARLRPETFFEKDGAWFDGLRPRIEPGGYATRDLLEAARLSHLRKVRQMFENSAVFIFTLGLTERWEDGETGSVFPLFPGAVDGAFARPAHRFHNARVTEVIAELDRFITLVRGHNPELRFLFTVSPVPLVATATGGHVLPATVGAKAVLRTAAGEVQACHKGCDYFPAYEIVTASPFCGDAFEADRRSVKPEVVRRVIRVFLTAQGLTPCCAEPGPDAFDAVCEEILLDAVRR
ncbi:GSCFA family protein [Rhodovulum imhoffii]|uniref:GSCFA family protein n=1 Tax=Rhodovulum imhoffii TaxID=365340 RepID=A0A2T5BWN9_9RHOB|nr:GSCFA domain-containing protein [Rhodovulum imhoffii]MBK5933283.1 hypothetical protein [Rhodovulum imhoffii]PTN04042.1 GSCFA family protein [Rhodovulum imhoffii]